MSRNLVICLDGTSNEPETGMTNVARMYDVAEISDAQLVYYDPGVGTMGARGAVTPWGRRLTRLVGLVSGFGIKDNLEEAYGWLMEHYQRDDRIFVFGFSRGAYTARALTGMLRTVGLLRPGASNLIPYAVKLYAQSGADSPTKEEDRAFWRQRDQFVAQFGNPDFPNPFDPHRHQVHHLGVWDTVKSVGWLNWKARIEQARWPFTNRITNVGTARHAMAIDERRRPYPITRFDERAVAESDGRYGRCGSPACTATSAASTPTTTTSPTSPSPGWSTRRAKRVCWSTRRRTSGCWASGPVSRSRSSAPSAGSTPTPLLAVARRLARREIRAGDEVTPACGTA